MTSGTRDQWLERHRTLGDYERVGYAGLGEEYNKWIYRLRRRHFLRLAGRHKIDSRCRILDVGSGTGFYVGLYRDLNVRSIHGADISPEAVKSLSRRFPDATFAACDIGAGLPSPVAEAAPFDVVSAMDVLYHITDDNQWKRAVRNCGEAVAPGGLLLISDNFPTRPVPVTATQSFHTFSEHASILKEQGFRLVEMSPVFLLSNGQVGSGIGYAGFALWWWLFKRVLGGTLRSARSVGEPLGAVSGAVLTTIDAMLQRQSVWTGYSTKVAVFRR
ncbi:MAG TPA: class I SAM-dependent methyltransferase [Phycisphaerae bacterium]|nr:class I SAM-dependent methyltransferase [Phycisphaerae bacterium]